MHTLPRSGRHARAFALGVALGTAALAALASDTTATSRLSRTAVVAVDTPGQPAAPPPAQPHARPELRAEHGPANTIDGELLHVDPARRTIQIKSRHGRVERFRYTEMTLVKGATTRVAGLAHHREPVTVTVRYDRQPRHPVASEIVVHGLR